MDKEYNLIRLLNKYYKAILITFFLLAIFVRVWEFGKIPAGFNQDGAMAAVDAKALADYGTDRFGMKMPVHFTAWGYGQMSVLMSYLMVPFIKIFGLSAYTARIPTLIVSLLAIYVLYKFVNKAYGKWPALVVTAFAAINPWHIMQSRWALDCNLLPHFFLFGMYFLYIGLEKRKYLYISMIFFGLCMYTYGIAFFSIPIFLMLACTYLLVKKDVNIKQALLCIVIYILVSWPIIAVMIINYLKIDTISTPFFTIPFFKDSVRMNDILYFSEGFFDQLKVNFKKFFNVVFLQKPDLPWNTIKDFGHSYLITIPFFGVGLMKLILDTVKNKENNLNKANVFIIIYLITGIFTGISINSVNVNRINIIFYLIIILSAYGLYILMKNIKLLALPIFILYFILFINFNVAYFDKDSTSLSFYKGFGEALDYVQDMEYDKIYVTADVQYKGSSHVSEILTLFHHEIDAEYFQGIKDEYSRFGEKLLPYKERYRYVDIERLNIDENENAVYVVLANESYKFNSNYFDITRFDGYCAITRKSQN